MPKSQLRFAIRFENLTPGELGVLLTALGLSKPGLILKLGGGKPTCYGSAIIHLDSLQVWDNVLALYTAYEAQYVSRSPSEYLAAASDLLLLNSFEQLAEIWTYDTKRPCPEGNY